MFKYGLKYFCEHRVAEKDIVLFPLIYSSHCSLIIVLKRTRTVIYLNSLRGPSIPTRHIEHILNLYAEYGRIKCMQQDMEGWVVYYPKDIPQQKNGYDCGLYCCMYAEVLIRRNLKLAEHAFESNMDSYRQRVFSKLMEYIKNPLPCKYVFIYQ